MDTNEKENLTEVLPIKNLRVTESMRQMILDSAQEDDRNIRGQVCALLKLGLEHRAMQRKATHETN